MKKIKTLSKMILLSGLMIISGCDLMIKNQANEQLCARPVLEFRYTYNETRVSTSKDEFVELMQYVNCLEQK